MDITKFTVSSREKSLLYGDYAVYRTQLAGKLLNSRRKLDIATKSRGKYHAKGPISAEQVAENHEYVRLQLLTAERAWAHAMAMKASHSADTKGISGKTRSHIVSRLDKAAKTAEKLAEVLEDETSGASSVDILEAHAYAALLKGAAQFEKRSWEACLRSYSVARIIYSALSTSAKVDIFKDLLADTIDPSIRYAAYQIKIPRTQPITAIVLRSFHSANSDLTDRINQVNPGVLESGDKDAEHGISGSESVPATLKWRGREVKIEDASIAVAWGAIGAARDQLAKHLAQSADMDLRDMAAAYDDILTASQDAADAAKQAIDELAGEGVPQSDSRMQSLQITRTAVNYEMISWRIGRNRVLMGEADGARLFFGENRRKRKTQEQPSRKVSKEEAPGRQIAKLKEKVVLYDGTLQSLESITELPGVANDQELSARLEATSKYFAALRSLAIARSHSIAGNETNGLALTKYALDQCEEALPVLSSGEDSSTPSLRSIVVTEQDIRGLQDLLSGELQRSRALVEISQLRKPATASGNHLSRPLVERLAEYPAGGVDLENIVVYPPRTEAIPVKPIFLDVAWNYIEYPDKQIKPEPKAKDKGVADKAAGEEAKSQKRGWFGFGR